MSLLRNVTAPDIQIQAEFAEWLLQVGQRSVASISSDDGTTTIIQLPSEMVPPVRATIQSLITKTYPNLHANLGNGHYLVQRAILCPTNEGVNEINNEIMAMVADPLRESREYLSADSILESDDTAQNLYPVEFLNSLNTSSLPPHRMTLAIGTPIMLLRNLRPREGLCNGTRLICTAFRAHFIEA